MESVAVERREEMDRRRVKKKAQSAVEACEVSVAGERRSEIKVSPRGEANGLFTVCNGRKTQMGRRT